MYQPQTWWRLILLTTSHESLLLQPPQYVDWTSAVRLWLGKSPSFVNKLVHLLVNVCGLQMTQRRRKHLVYSATC